ncbi:MAG: glycosyltransferase family 1 protein [Desulforudis sp.]|nr:MAG: glycosyltransferase family 1 protein [Desulforudis sp.]
MTKQNEQGLSREYNDIRHLFWSPAEVAPVEVDAGKSRLDMLGINRSLTRGDTGDTVIVYPPTIDWHFMKQRPQQLMQQFALHGHQVYYCNKMQSKDRKYTQVIPNLTVVHDNKAFIREAIPFLKRQGKRILVWSSWSKLHLFLDQYAPDILVYDYVDDFPAWVPYLEKMVHMADVVCTTASSLKQHIERDFSGKPCYLIPNGCDLDHFQQYKHAPPERPVEYQDHDGPIITYIGAWAHWVDHDLVEQVAAAFPEALVSIIGVEYGAKVSQSVPNLKYLGYKFHEVLPRYLYYTDVCLIPFRLNQITLATNPVKMYEYLAAGRPVVTTDLPEARNAPGVNIGKDRDSFVSCVGRILSSLIAFDADEVNRWLRLHTWENRYKRIDEILEGIAPR